MGQEQDVNDLMKMRDELSQERDKLLNDITQLRRDLDDSAFKQSDLERQIQESNEQIAALQEKITLAKTENMKEAKKRVRRTKTALITELGLRLGTNRNGTENEQTNAGDAQCRIQSSDRSIRNATTRIEKGSTTFTSIERGQRSFDERKSNSSSSFGQQSNAIHGNGDNEREIGERLCSTRDGTEGEGRRIDPIA